MLKWETQNKKEYKIENKSIEKKDYNTYFHKWILVL